LCLAEFYKIIYYPHFFERGIITMTNFRTMLLSTAAMGLMTISAVSSTSAADVEKKMSWSGFVNRAIIMGDDGENNFTSHTDPTGVAQSRGRIKGSAKSDTLTTGMLIELGLSNGANATQSANGGASFSVRHSALYVSNSMGKVTVGHTAHAGEAYTSEDASGTSIATSYSATPYNAVLFNDSSSTAGSPAAGVSVATAHGGAYSAGRESGISYSSPKFNGFSAMVSHRTDASGAYNLRYGGDFNGVKLTAGYAYANMATASGTEASAATDSIHGGGVSVTLPSGLNYSVTHREEDKNSLNTAPDGNSWMHKVGYKMTGVSDLGGTNVALMYKKAEDASTTGDKYENISLLFTQALSDYGTTVYGGFSNMSYDTTASNFDDINGIFMGATVNF
jgi:hypothetical protein